MLIAWFMMGCSSRSTEADATSDTATTSEEDAASAACESALPWFEAPPEDEVMLDLTGIKPATNFADIGVVYIRYERSELSERLCAGTFEGGAAFYYDRFMADSDAGTAQIDLFVEGSETAAIELWGGADEYGEGGTMVGVFLLDLVEGAASPVALLGLGEIPDPYAAAR